MEIIYKGIKLKLKQLSSGKYEKPNVVQFTKKGRGCLWLDDCRIPYENEDNIIAKNPHTKSKGSEAYQNVCYGKYNPTEKPIDYTQQQGRFPANLLVSDDVLNDGKTTKSEGGRTLRTTFRNSTNLQDLPFQMQGYGDTGSFSRYFDLDKWAQKTFPFLIVPKASKSEKNKGLDNLPERDPLENVLEHDRPGTERFRQKPTKNYHPTVKPIKLMSYLIILGSRPNDVILDPFVGSGTTLISCKLLNRKGIGIDNNKEYCDIAVARLKAVIPNLL